MAHLIPITDFSDPALDIYARLTATSFSGYGCHISDIFPESPQPEAL